MDLVRIPGILKVLFPGITWSIRSEQPSVYLTFDDGPTPVVTDEVLAILKQFGAKATFFCIGRNVERHPEIYKRILQEGHATGNHTYSHLKGWGTPNREYFEDIDLASQFVKSSLYRPAYGMITPSQLRYLRSTYRIVLWDIMSYDFAENTSPEKCINYVIRNARPGSVIVFHDSLKAAPKLIPSLPRILDHFTSLKWKCNIIK